MNRNADPADMMSDDLDAIVSMNDGDFSVIAKLLRNENYLPSNEVRLLLAEFLSEKGNGLGRLVFKRPKGKPPKRFETWLREAFEAHEAVNSELNKGLTLDAAFHEVSNHRLARSWEAIRDAYYDFQRIKQAFDENDSSTK